MTDLEYDTANIYKEHRETFALLKETIDLNQVVFVGGVADYLNLRGRYKMPINDFDLVLSNPSILEQIKKQIKCVQTETLYLNDSKSVFQANYIVNGCCVHLDFFEVTSIYEHAYCSSQFLGSTIQHHNFDTMREFHNNQIETFTTNSQGSQYDWKRLYKHSKKGALYNLANYSNEQPILTKA